MIEEEYQPSPDELLRAIQKEESQKNLGKLKIFFGMSAGVGKTYAMLEEAQERFKEGMQVIVGVVNTHGRKETEELLQGLPIISEKWVKYRDTVFEEMDLETILQKKPTLVLVDELAHTNVPGSRHAKRWQDVIEILDAGINVYTTLNVQHVESRKDIVESFTGVQIRETVPDLILERADTIELVDITPAELLQRLHEGKVYLGDQSKLAIENFFKEDTLMALREIALRFTAEKVDHDLHLLFQTRRWKTREKLMVAISPSPHSQQLIRTTRRRAFELDVPWVAIYVDTGRILSDEEQTRLTQHLSLARDLGADVVVTHDLDIAAAIQRVAQQKSVSQLVIGRPTYIPFFQKWFRESLIDRIEKENKQLDLLILRQDRLTSVYQGIYAPFSFQSTLRDYGIAVAFITGLSLIGALLNPFIGYRPVGFIFLLGILLLSFFVGTGPIFLAAILSTIIWDIFFIPPIFYHGLSSIEDFALVLIYFATATIIGMMTHRMRKQDYFLKMREKKLEHLYEIEREIANAANYQYLRLNVTSHLQSIFDGKFDILIKNAENQLIFDSQLPQLQQEKEQAVAQWAFQKGTTAGWSTSTLPSAAGLYLPLKFAKIISGVLVYYPKRERPFSLDEMNFLQTVAQHLGIYLERYLFEERVLNQSYMNQVEKLHHSLLRSISEALYTPLNKILESTQEIKALHQDPKSRQLIQAVEQEENHLKLMISNLLAASELESGFVRFEKDKYEVKAFLEACVKETAPFLGDHPVHFAFPERSIYLSFDSRLMALAINNLLIYAAESPPGSPITIEGRQDNQVFKISISHEGPGIPADMLPFIFDKSQRIFRLPSKNHSLEFFIVKSVVDIHQGQIEVQNHEPTGATISLSLPQE